MSLPIDEVSRIVVDTAVQIHRGLGPGLLESVYEVVLANRLRQRGLSVEQQKRVCFTFDGIEFDEGLRIDLLVENDLVVELKPVELLAPVHGKQLLTYLRLLNKQVGLLLNFGAPLMKDGIHRVVNNYVAPPTLVSK